MHLYASFYPVNVCRVVNGILLYNFNKSKSVPSLYSVLSHMIVFVIFEPPYNKTNKMSFAPSEDSDQPGHPPSLIRVFAVGMKKYWALNYLLSAQ